MMKPSKNQNKLPVATLLHQFALQQMTLALDYVTNDTHEADLAIHETRRCLKRLRAILRLVKEGVGKTTYDRDNRYFRDLGQRLAKLRDTTVVQETLADLQKKFSTTFETGNWETIQKDLVGARQDKKKALRNVAAKLKIARSRVDNWPLKYGEKIAWRRALRKTYQKGQRAMKYALAQPQAENFHEWRKQVNHLRHQLQILQTLKIAVAHKSLKSSQALAKNLGVKNDLAVLSQRLLKLKQAGRESELHRLAQLIQSTQAEYEAGAIKLGHRLYHKPPKTFIRSMAI